MNHLDIDAPEAQALMRTWPSIDRMRAAVDAQLYGNVYTDEAGNYQPAAPYHEPIVHVQLQPPA
jgi:hypothetical protein